MEVEAAGKGGDKQSDKVRALFNRQLQLPLAGHAETLEAYKEWEAKHGKVGFAVRSLLCRCVSKPYLPWCTRRS